MHDYDHWLWIVNPLLSPCSSVSSAISSIHLLYRQSICSPTAADSNQLNSPALSQLIHWRDREKKTVSSFFNLTFFFFFVYFILRCVDPGFVYKYFFSTLPQSAWEIQIQFFLLQILFAVRTRTLSKVFFETICFYSFSSRSERSRSNRMRAEESTNKTANEDTTNTKSVQFHDERQAASKKKKTNAKTNTNLANAVRRVRAPRMRRAPIRHRHTNSRTTNKNSFSNSRFYYSNRQIYIHI